MAYISSELLYIMKKWFVCSSAFEALPILLLHLPLLRHCHFHRFTCPVRM